MSRETKVYVINRSGHDYSYAEKFGQLVYLSKGSMDKYKVSKIARLFAERLADSQPNDYILVTGLTVMSMIAAAMFAHKHGRLNLLIHRPDNTYVAREIVLDGLC